MAVAAIVAVLGVVIGRELGIGEETIAEVAVKTEEPAASKTTGLSDDSDSTADSQAVEGQLTLKLSASQEAAASKTTELSDGSDSDADGQAVVEQLTLSLNASQEVCETEDVSPYGTAHSYQDEDGNWVYEEELWGYWNIPSVPVGWQVSGGQEPYTLVIDHESEDENGEYQGVSGTANVGCADASGGTSFDEYYGRVYAIDPQVDSGWKTVRAVVTDANGDTAETTTQFYVLRDLGTGTTGDIMKRGETYRVLGGLITAPASFDVVVGSMVERECKINDPDPRCGNTIHGFWFADGDAGIGIYEDFTVANRGIGPTHDANRAASATEARNAQLEAAIDSLVDSLGRPPEPQGSSE